MPLELHNPHSVLAALKTRPTDVREVHLARTKPHGVWQEVVRLAEQHGIPIDSRPSAGRNPKRETQGSGRTAAAFAKVDPRPSVPLESLVRGARSGGGLWLALDQLHDPQNVGAIFRTAAFCGLQGVITTRDRSAPLNATVYDVACGGIDYVPFCLVTNLRRSLEEAQTSGLWILGSSEHAERDVWEIPRDRPWLLVLGNEEKGLRRLTGEHCDDLCRLKPRGPITSLNVSVAAGVLMTVLTRSPTETPP